MRLDFTPSKLFFGALAVCLVLAFASQVNAASLQELSLDTWTTSEGLPHNQVQGIAQTPDGYLWLATWEGLARFNGFEFTVFNSDNTPAIGNRAVRDLAVDHDGTLWLGTTRNGLVSYQQGQWRSLTATDGLAADQVLKVLVDSQNRVWAATEEHGVSVFDGEHFTNYSGDQLLGVTVLDLAQSNDGAIWIATRNGINVIRDGVVDAFTVDDGLPDAPVMALLAVSGMIYAGTEAGLYQLRGERFVIDPRWSETDSAAVAELYLGLDGSLYAGTFASGLFRLRERGVERLNTHNGLPNNRIRSMFEDRERNLWVGSNGGLARMRSAPFTSLTMRAGLSDNYVRAVSEAANGDLWVATGNGLTRLRDDRSTVFGKADGLGTDSVTALAQIDYELWAGTYGEGVVRIAADDVMGVIKAPTIPSNHVRTIIKSSDDSVWIGTVAGLTRLQDDQATTYTIEDGLPRSYINALFEDRSGRLWIGAGEGMAWFENGQIIALNEVEGYANADVFHFYEDGSGNVWAATEDGLLRHRPGDEKRFDRVGPEHGLPHPVLFSVIGDREGNLWLSSNGGIFRAALDDLTAVAAGHASHVNFQRFTEDEGLPSIQSNGGTQPAATLLGGGRLAFATAGGVAVVDPARVDSLLGAASQPKPVIEEVSIDFRPVELRAPPIVEPDARRLEVRYVGLNLGSPETVRYRHRLIGFDDDWSETVTDRTAQYTNLPPGDYRFEVAAAAPLTDWSEVPASVEFQVRPQLHQMVWFRAAMLGLLALAIWAGMRWRVASLRHQASELTREVDHRTRHLRNQTQRLLEASREKTDLLQKLEEQSAAFARQAREDALTELNNRRHFDELMEQAFHTARERGESLTVAILDIDYFKQVNDHHSHEVGDQVLKIVADTIRLQLQPFPVETARYGGEEFVMLFRDMSVVTASELCERVRAAVASHDYSAIASGLRVTVSVGLCDRLDVPSHEKMLSMADKCLYQAKGSGRDKVCY